MSSFHEWLGPYLATLAQTDGAGLVVATVLLLLDFCFLPKPARPYLRLPVLLLCLHLFCIGLRPFFEHHPQTDDALSLAALFLLLTCNGTALFLFVTRGLFRRWAAQIPKIFLDILHGLIYVAAFLILLRAAGVEVSSLLTGSALVTAALGLSLRDTLGNLFAGLAIQAQQPFALGDWIQFDPNPTHIGQVVEINWRATTVRTLDALEIIIPNATLGTGYIINYSRPEAWVRRSIYFHAPYDVPPGRVQQIVLEAIAGAWGVLAEPAATVVTLDFSESGVRYWLRYFTAEFGKRDLIDGSVRDRVWYALRRHGIEFPAPMRAVDLRHRQAAKEGDGESVAQRIMTLRCVDFFVTLSDQELECLGTLSRVRLYGQGETILRQGDSGEELFILSRGEVVVTLERPGLPDTELTRLGAGSFFGEMSLLTGEPRSATVRASKECELLVVNKEAFRQVLESSPQLAERISETIAGRQANQARVGEVIVTDGPRREEWGRRLLGKIREFFSR